MLAQRIQRARQGAGLSLRALAQRTGVTQTTTRNYELGRGAPSSAMLLKLGPAMGVKTEYFFRPQQMPLRAVAYRKRRKL